MLNVSGLNEYLSYVIDQKEALSIFILLISIGVLLSVYSIGIKFPFSGPVKTFFTVFLLFLGLAGFSSILNLENDYFFWGFRYYLPSLLIYVSSVMGFLFMLRYSTLKLLIGLLRVAFLVNTFTVVVSYLFGFDFLVPIGERASGINLNANSAGYIGALALTLELFRLSIKRSLWQYFVILVVLFGIFITFSKSAFIMALGIQLLYMYRLLKSSGRFANLHQLLGLFVLVAIAVFQVQNSMSSLSIDQRNRILQVGMLLKGDLNTQSTTNRSDLAILGWEKITEGPFIGHGFQTMTRLGDKVAGVHNQYMLLWGEGGIVAFLAYVYLLFQYLKKARSLPGAYRFLVSGILFCIAFYSVSNHNMYSSKSLMIVLAFLAVLFKNFDYVRYIRSNRTRTPVKL